VNGEVIEQHDAMPGRAVDGSASATTPELVGGRGATSVRRGTDVLVGHGYTVADLDQLARKAAYTSRWLFMPFAERRDLARFAITEHLLTTADSPEFWSLVNLGEKAIGAHVEQEGRYRGVYLARTGVELGAAMPRFWRYWSSASQPTRSPEDAIVDLTALTQIWPRLTRPHQAVLVALATHSDYQEAAAALGKPYHSFVSTVSTARKQFLRLWHEHEIPSGVWGRDRRDRPRAEVRRSVTVVTVRRRKRRREARQAEEAAMDQ
jgi:hypothetical protein